jgi:flavin reductase (DIM6/NTAB) family NADH-FMN oxidoreductase RutF
MSTPPYEPVGDAVEALKATFRRHASGVAILTALDAHGQPVAFTATSVTSLGANPPLVSFNVARGSSSWPAISEATHVALHTLGTENLELAKKMSQDHTQRFVDTDWQPGLFDLPILGGVTSVLVLRVRQIVAIEANAVLIADVVDGLIGAEQRPLLYFKRDYITGTEI